MNEILIYTPKETNRIRYVFRLVFEILLKVKYQITSNLDFFQSSDLPKMMYGFKAHTDDIFFQSTDLLFEKGVHNLDIKGFEYDGNMVFFTVNDDDAELPFDIFAAIFYLVSRYEEYLPFVKDQYGRFTAQLSTSTRLKILEKPVVNIWAIEIKKIILKKYPDFIFPEKKFRFIPTYDIDVAWAYKQKGIFRQIGGIYRDLTNLNFNNIKQRFMVLTGNEKDPYETYDLQLEYQRKYNLHPVYFILFAEYSQFDKNINYHRRKFRRLIKWLADYAAVGIHPSYFSLENPEFISLEKNRLEDLLKTDITMSRQHYLRLFLPDTYNNLIENDLLEDYSMGYAALPGFRAGICDTFPFYDLELETETKLRIHPFTVMDGTLNDYMHLSPEQAIVKIESLMQEVKKVNGTFISLWHNESLSDQKRWKGWRKVYESLLQMAAS